MRRRWDEEWGKLGKEGNIWWLGNGTKGWIDVMGTNRWGWICECFLHLSFFFPLNLFLNPPFFKHVFLSHASVIPFFLLPI